MLGLEKLLRGLYGSQPQIDMDRQLARARVPSPMTLDFAALAEGIKRNNVGTAAIEFEAEVVATEGRILLQPTGQAFLLSGTVQSGRRRLKVLDWEDPAKTRVEVVR